MEIANFKNFWDENEQLKTAEVLKAALSCDPPDDMKKFGVDYVTQQCRNLMDNGVKFFHFYTLNMAKSTSKIFDNLSLTSVK